MKTKILMFAVLMSLSAVLAAQPADGGPKKSFRGHEREMQVNDDHGGPAKGLNLTDAQKEAFKQSMLAVQKEIKPLRNELGEAEAHQKTLVSADNPDFAAINKNIEKIGDLKVGMAKIMVKHRLAMRSQLNEEQKLKFDMFSGKMNHGKKPMGMKRGHSLN